MVILQENIKVFLFGDAPLIQYAEANILRHHQKLGKITLVSEAKEAGLFIAVPKSINGLKKVFKTGVGLLFLLDGDLDERIDAEKEREIEALKAREVSFLGLKMNSNSSELGEAIMALSPSKSIVV